VLTHAASRWNPDTLPQRRSVPEADL